MNWTIVFDLSCQTILLENGLHEFPTAVDTLSVEKPGKRWCWPQIQKHYTDWKPFEWYVLVLLTDSEVISLMWDFVYLCFSRLCLSLVFCINGSIHVLYCFSVCLLTWRRQWLKISHLVWTDAFSISLRLLWSWPKWDILKTGSRFAG